MLGVLQSPLPDVPITAEIVDCSSELTDICCLVFGQYDFVKLI